MKQFFTLFVAILFTLPALAQSTFSIRGRVLDAVTGETLPGATVQATGDGQSTGGSTDADGSYKISGLAAGTYSVQASFVGYKAKAQTVRISTQSVVSTFVLTSDNASLDEVQVVASQAQERETPVAFSAVNEVKLRETLSNRDLPLILNETPGVYATAQGGGTGDSRINVRGFDQRNVAVLVNGVPVNDMENGQVFWSNWDLGDVTKSLQVQRGLSASKIAVPSVGGTINVLTKGSDAKKTVLARAETGSNNYQKYSLMLSTGELKGGWAATVFGSRRTNDGWVDKAFDDAWTYFGTISKRAGRHNLSLTGLGSPQRHGQRSFPITVGIYSDEKARELGVAPVANGNRGFAYNPYWGVLDRYTVDGSGNRVSSGQQVLNERTNFYHKPQVNFNDLWQVTDRLFVSTVLYASTGTGGGSSGLTSGNSTTISQNPVTLQTDFQKIYDDNIGQNPRLPNPTRKATQFLINSVNSHRWYGFVVGGDYLLNDKLTFSAGVDGRDYTGLHYREIRDLLGADYALAPAPDRNADPNARLRVGDKLGYNYDGRTRWLGGYSQLEYKTPLLSAVVSGTLSRVSYKRIDYFQLKQADGSAAQTDWTRFNGYSVKAGANYNLTEHDNIFANVGYNSKVPFFNLLYTNAGRQYDNVKPEGITSAEVGYGISYPSLKVTLNAYYTLWANKTTTSITAANSSASGQIEYNTVRNVNARHVGVELSVAQEISRRLQLNAAISLGDWRWTGQGLLNATLEDGSQAITESDVPVYLNGVHVGDAAQNQFQVGLRYEPFRGAYIRPSFLLFTKYYADFNPETIREPATSTDSYRLPTSRNLDLHLGYDFQPVLQNKVRFGLKGSVLNVLNEFYFTDVSNRSNSNTASLGNLQAFFNRGRTFTVGLSATL